MSPLRHQMHDAMLVRGLALRTRETYIEAVAKLARFYHAGPECMSQVVKAMQGIITPWSPAQMPKETAEGIADLPVIDREPVIQQEKPVTLGGLDRVVALLRIGTKFNADCLVHGDPAAPVAF